MIAAILAFVLATLATEPTPELVTFKNGALELKGFLYKPAGAGPFPAVLWNHGSDRKPGWVPEVP